MSNTEYDAIVVGSGPNGLAAAITMQQAGLRVLIVEGKPTIGGGLRTEELTLSGFKHDVCAAIHPMAVASPFLRSLPLEKYGLEYIHPPIALAHPYDNGTAAILTSSLEETAALLGADETNYLSLIGPIKKHLKNLLPDVLGPLRIPYHPIDMAQFGLNALQPATWLAKKFHTALGKGLWAGLAAHSILPLHRLTTSAIGLLLAAVGHTRGWPIPKGGSQSIATALAGYFRAIGGTVETDFYVRSLSQLPSSKAVLFDITPRQLLEIAGHRFSSIYRWQLERYRYGMGVFKVDWVIEGTVPFTSPHCRKAGTLHLGNTFGEIAAAQQVTSDGQHPDKPFVLLAQQSVFDATRSPDKDKHAVWGYCHVPNGSVVDMTDAIERQVERFAPGFRERILARHTFNTHQMEEHNPNYIGGDINGGVIDLSQLYTRPALRWSPYRTSARGLYLCSSSTPPGSGVHGMCGYHAARRALKDLFKIEL